MDPEIVGKINLVAFVGCVVAIIASTLSAIAGVWLPDGSELSGKCLATSLIIGGGCVATALVTKLLVYYQVV